MNITCKLRTRHDLEYYPYIEEETFVCVDLYSGNVVWEVVISSTNIVYKIDDIDTVNIHIKTEEHERLRDTILNTLKKWHDELYNN